MDHPVTGWHLALLQDCCRGLSRWFTLRANARQEARQAVADISDRG